ncbi:MAG: nicotinamide mononucleotide transporter [Saprospiraceae bacterium]|nr:nicotinamide mononucleotide transporter [Saprospiraceae bacterium]
MFSYILICFFSSFFSISIYGWIIWKFEKSNKIPLKYLTSKQRIYISLLILIASYAFGKFIANIHLLFPNLFPTAAVYPYLDSFVAISSIVANTLLAKRIIENLDSLDPYKYNLCLSLHSKRNFIYCT